MGEPRSHVRVITPPPQITVEKHGTGRAYEIDGRPVPGVTTVLNDGYPKPALVQWSANETARYAVQHYQDAATDPVGAYETWRVARNKVNTEAKVFGTQVHALAEQIGRGEEVDVPDNAAGTVDQCIRFLDQYQVQPIYQERTVANQTAGYCGTFDLIAETNRGTALLDWKTGRTGVWPEHALQLAAYRHAEWIKVAADSTVPMIQVDWCACVWLRADGFDVVPVVADGYAFRCFRYVLEVAKLRGAPRGTFVGDPL